MVDFVPCVGILIVRKCQRTAVNFDIFPIFELLCLTNCWLYFLLQGFHIKHSVFVRHFDLKLIDMCVALESWVQKRPNAVIFDKLPMFRDIFLPASILPQRLQSKKLYFSRSIGLKNYHFFLHWNPDGPKMPELFVIWTHLDCRTHVSPKQMISFLLSRSQSGSFHLFWNIPLKIIPCSGILMDQKCEEVLLFWSCLDIQTQIASLLYLLHYPIKDSIEYFASAVYF